MTLTCTFEVSLCFRQSDHIRFDCAETAPGSFWYGYTKTELEKMLDKRINLKHREIKFEKYKIVKTENQHLCSPENRKLSTKETEILRSKRFDEVQLRQNLLLELDSYFGFNRTNLAKFLKKYGLNGYSRSNIYKLIGSPVFNQKEYKIISKAFAEIGEPALLSLLISKKALKQASASRLGGMPFLKSDTCPSTVTNILEEEGAK